MAPAVSENFRRLPIPAEVRDVLSEPAYRWCSCPFASEAAVGVTGAAGWSGWDLMYASMSFVTISVPHITCQWSGYVQTYSYSPSSLGAVNLTEPFWPGSRSFVAA